MYHNSFITLQLKSYKVKYELYGVFLGLMPLHLEYLLNRTMHSIYILELFDAFLGSSFLYND